MVFDGDSKIINSPARKRLGNDEVAKEIESASRRREKLLCELDFSRRFGCQAKMARVLIKVQQVSNFAMKEKLYLQESIRQETHAKYLKEEEEIYHRLHEEEQEARRRQERIVLEHEQHAKRVQDINQMIQEAEQKQKQKEEEEKEKRIMKERKILLDQCLLYYEALFEIVKSCRNKAVIMPKISGTATKLKNFSEKLENQIHEKYKLDFTIEDLQMSAELFEEAKQLIEQIHQESRIEQINNEIELQQAIAASEQPTQTVEPDIPGDMNCSVIEVQSIEPSQQSNPTITSTKTVMDEFVEREAFRKYIALKAFSEDFAKLYYGLLEDENTKKFRFDCQKAVNIPVNAISPVSVPHLQDKLTKLHRLLSGQTVEVGRAHFTAAQHPHGIAFCKNLLAKKFVSQGETTVSCKPEAAFAIAAVIISLWADFPDFGQLLLAHFHKECPYLVPIFLPQVEGQSDVEYYKSLGYRYTENGEVEKQDKFLKRMSGIMHLYCAIIVTPLKRSSKVRPIGMGEAWRWLACLVNMDPRPDICAILLYEFLEVMGDSMYRYYGESFQKILHLICTEYFPKIEKVTPMHARGPVARLESFLQKILKQGRIPPPVGLLPHNFW